MDHAVGLRDLYQINLTVVYFLIYKNIDMEMSAHNFL